MGQANIWVIDIIGPAILLIVLVCLVIRAPTTHNRRDEECSGQPSSDSCPDEPQQRRNGIESL